VSSVGNSQRTAGPTTYRKVPLGPKPVWSAVTGPASYTNFVLLNIRSSVLRLRRSILDSPHPGLTAGPGHCRPFGPYRAFKSGVNRAAVAPGADVWPPAPIPTKPRREAPSGNSSERQFGVKGGREKKPEGPAHRSISFVSRDPSSYKEQDWSPLSQPPASQDRQRAARSSTNHILAGLSSGTSPYRKQAAGSRLCSARESVGQSPHFKRARTVRKS
jgi:hypothetical protein